MRRRSAGPRARTAGFSGAGDAVPSRSGRRCAGFGSARFSARLWPGRSRGPGAPGQQVTGDRGGLAPRGIDRVVPGWQVSQAGAFRAADIVFDPGLGAVAGFEELDLPVGRALHRGRWVGEILEQGFGEPLAPTAGPEPTRLRRRRPRTYCAARILDCTADLGYRQQT
jgi:hypothetical protein